MKPRAISLRPAAERDFDIAAAYYAEQGGLALELRFIEAIVTAFDHLANHPASGSLRYATLFRMQGLRYWPIKTFPYLVFYLEDERSLDIWRILHAERDIPASLRMEG